MSEISVRSTSPRWRLALLIVAGAHLALVTAGAVGAPPRDSSRLGRALAEYAALSGAETYYTFFAPTVNTQVRPVFEVTDGAGGARTDVLRRPTNTEVDLRLANLFGETWWEDEVFHRALLASWAGVMFARYPGAERVEVRVEACEVPAMAAYREGQRSRWTVLERAAFTATEARR